MKTELSCDRYIIFHKIDETDIVFMANIISYQKIK